MRTVVLLRHGETEWNRTGRVQGWAATALNDRGREQARTTGAHLASTYDFDRVVCSDLRRARETVALVREAGIEPVPEFDRAWRERDAGVYQGAPYGEMVAGAPDGGEDAGAVAVETPPEDGESMRAVRERVLDAWEDVLAGTDDTLVVAHGGPLGLLVGHLRGQDLWTAAGLSLDNCAITEVRVDGDGHGVVRENETVYDPRRSRSPG